MFGELRVFATVIQKGKFCEMRLSFSREYGIEDTATVTGEKGEKLEK